MGLKDSVKDSLGRLVAGLDRLHGRAQRGWRRVSPFGRRWRIEPYLGFGTRERVTIGGRVLRPIEHRAPAVEDTAWQNVAEFWKRLESDELPGACVRGALAGRTVEAVTDEEGHFELTVDADPPLACDGWHVVELQLVGVRGGDPQAVRGEALVPPPSARFAVVSDIDDTIVWSDVQRKARMLAMLMRSNARTRKPFAGVAAFYRALQAGVEGSEGNPFFYVSSSPWNLHGPLVDFLDAQRLPRGPLMLRDFGDHLLFGSDDHGEHKRKAIERLLRTYPAMTFVLIGDSGEQDPEIYRDVVVAHPDRVRVIYIRSVDPDPGRLAAIDALVAAVQPTGVELVLAPDSAFAASHAASIGLMRVDALAEVRAHAGSERR